MCVKVSSGLPPAFGLAFLGAYRALLRMTRRPKRSDDGFGARTACGVRMNALASSQAPHHAPPCKHAVSFALLLVLSKPKHRFGFVRRNGGADVELSGLPGKRNGASPFGRYPLLHSSFPSRKSSLRLGDAGVRMRHRSKRPDNGFGARTACVRARRRPA